MIGKDTGRMAQSAHQQAEAAYERIVDSIEELTALIAEADDVDDEDAVDHGEIIHHLAEDASERGLDEENVGRVLKAVYAMAKKR
jgi:hypothetical protein